MEYGWHVVHYAAPTIDIYRAEPDGAPPLHRNSVNCHRLGVVLEDATQAMCTDYLDDLCDEIGGDRISAVWGSLVVSCQYGHSTKRRAA